MGVWNTARGLLASSVVTHLGEALTLVEAGDARAATVRGVLTRPEEVERLGLSQVIGGHARVTLRKADAPSWLGRGVTVTNEADDEVFEVTAVADNGEGVLEVVLCRSL